MSALPCSEWSGQRNDDGYGIIPAHERIGGEMYAHRAAWKKAHGPIERGLWVLHRCDNRACRELSHLYLGTNADNVRDRQERGRQARGLRHGKAKLSDLALAEIRVAVAAGYPQKLVAAELGVSRSLVSFIVNGKRRAPAPELREVAS